jgi:glutamine amidotransferase
MIIDYGMGNLRSVEKKFNRIGAKVKVSSDPHDIGKSDCLVLPGVGHFESGVRNLIDYNLWDTLNEAVLIKRKTVLGICLGMQLMANRSEEGNVNGLGWIDAEVVRFQIENKQKYKIPHMGWNTIERVKECDLFNEIDASDDFYFVHSYYIKCKEAGDILTNTEYENKFVSSVLKENILGFQFHPEKSHDAGEKLLSNFIKQF